MVTMHLNYLGDLRVEAIHGPSQTKLVTDAPVDNQGKGESFSPTDLVATGLGACMITLMGIMAKRHQLNLEGLAVKVDKIMTSEQPRRIQKLVCNFKCEAVLTTEQTKMLERSAMTCPVKQSLNPNIEIEVHFNWKHA